MYYVLYSYARTKDPAYTGYLARRYRMDIIYVFVYCIYIIYIEIYYVGIL